MKKICILTATRAEYGLLKPIMQRISSVNHLEMNIVVTGAHLSPEFGLTYKEINNDGFDIDKKIEILLSADTPSSISKSMGLAMISFADYFAESKPDLLVVLGDRYETLAVVTAATNQRIPVAHLYGGETTEGACDESFRHAITKMSYLHFTSTEKYRQRIVQLGEHPSRVFNVGSLGVENVNNLRLLSKSDLEDQLKFELSKPYAIITFHPVTLELNTAEEQIKQLLSAVEKNPDMNYIFTKGNSDADGRIINELIDEFVAEHDNCRCYTSLGVMKYLSAVKNSCMVIGNSSSGLIEVPSFQVPTINIGDRQRGRIKGKSVIDCKADVESIQTAIKEAHNLNKDMVRHSFKNPYEMQGTSKKIVECLDKLLQDGEPNLKKKFFDLSYDVNKSI